MNLSLKQLRYLCAVASEGSIQRAAGSLRISPSSILAALAIAEAELGALIFVRKPARGVAVTPAGERFITAARVFLAAHEEFERRTDLLAAGPPAQIRIGCFEPFSALFMTSVLRRYRDAVGPVSITLLEGDQEQLRTWLESGAVDAVVTYDIAFQFEGATPICSVPTHAVLHRDDPLARQERVALRDLAERPFLLLDLPLTAPFLLATFDVLGIRPEIALRTRSYEAVRCAVAEGFGATLLNMRPSAAGGSDPPAIARRPLSEALSTPTVVVADIYGHLKPSFIQHFIAATEEHFRVVGREGYAVL